MSMKSARHQIVVVGCEGGDWEGVYLDGALSEEGHSHIAGHSLPGLCKRLGVDFCRVTVSNEWMEWAGNLPAKFSDIPDAAIVGRSA